MSDHKHMHARICVYEYTSAVGLRVRACVHVSHVGPCCRFSRTGPLQMVTFIPTVQKNLTAAGQDSQRCYLGNCHGSGAGFTASDAGASHGADSNPDADSMEATSSSKRATTPTSGASPGAKRPGIRQVAPDQPQSDIPYIQLVPVVQKLFEQEKLDSQHFAHLNEIMGTHAEKIDHIWEYVKKLNRSRTTWAASRRSS